MLGGFFKQLIGDANSPQNIAGTANFLNPGSFSQALLQATAQQNEQQHNQLQQYKQQMEQQQALKRQQTMGKLAELIGTGAKPEDINKELLNSGLEHADISTLSKLLTPNIKDQYNPVEGNLDRFKDGIYQGPTPGAGQAMQQTAQATNGPNSAVSAVGGNGHANTPAGQKESHLSQLRREEKGIATPAERTAEEKVNKEYREKGNASRTLIRELFDYDKALRDLQGSTNIPEGSPIRRTETGDKALGKFSSQKSRALMDKINKGKDAIARNIASQQTNSDAASKEALRQSIPDYKNEPEAQRAFVQSRLAEAIVPALEDRFREQWKVIAKDMPPEERDIAFGDFVQSIDVQNLDEKSYQSVYKSIPAYIRGVLNGEITPEEMRQGDLAPGDESAPQNVMPNANPRQRLIDLEKKRRGLK